VNQSPDNALLSTSATSAPYDAPLPGTSATDNVRYLFLCHQWMFLAMVLHLLYKVVNNVNREYSFHLQCLWDIQKQKQEMHREEEGKRGNR